MKGWRTILVNALLLVDAGLNLGGVQSVPTLPADWVAIVAPIVNFALRAITTTPVGKPE